MAPRSLLWPDPRVKPPFGAAEIDWGHPLANGLSVSHLFNELGGSRANNAAGGVAQGTVNLLGTSLWKPDGLTFFDTYAERLDYGSVTALSFISVAEGTFSARVKPTGTPTDDPSALNLQTIGLDSNGNARLTRGKVSSGADSWYFLANDGASRSVSSPATVDTWAMVTWVHRGGQLYGFVNGVPIGNVTCNDIINMQYGLAYVFGQGGAAGTGFKGAADYFYANKRGLTHGEVAWLSAEPYAMLRPIIRRRYFVPAVAASGLARIIGGGFGGGTARIIGG